MFCKGFVNSNNKRQLLFDRFVRLGAVKQIIIILIIVIIIFILITLFWDSTNEKQKQDINIKVNSELLENIRVAKVKDSVTTILGTNSENNNFIFNDSESYLITFTSETDTIYHPNLKKAQLYSQLDKIANSINNVPVLSSDETSQNLWEDLSYDIFVHSINPGTSEQIPSRRNQGLVFALFLLTSFGLSGLVFTILINLFERRKEKWEKGDLNYKFFKDFILIVGGSKMVVKLCEDLFSNSNPKFNDNLIILIQTRSEATVLRKELESKIGLKNTDKIFIYNGDRTSRDDLQILYPQNASEIFIIGEDTKLDGNSHDAFSIECLDILNQIVTINKPIKPKWYPRNLTIDEKVRCHLMLDHQDTTRIFKYSDRRTNPHLDLIIFNYYEKWGAQVLVNSTAIVPNYTSCVLNSISNQKSEYLYPSILGNEPKIFIDSEKRVHLIIINMSEMGSMFATLSAHLCHFPNFFINSHHPRTLITFIDKEADIEMDNYKGRNPNLFEMARWRYVDANQYINADRLSTGDIYQNIFMGINPMKGFGMQSIYRDSDIDPDLMDIDWEFIKGEITNSSVQKYLRQASYDKNSVTTIAICSPNANEGVSDSTLMPQEVYESENITQILVLQKFSDAVVRSQSKDLAIKTRFINQDGQSLVISPYKKIMPFGMYEKFDYLNKLDLLPIIINYLNYLDIYDPKDGFLSRKDIYNIFEREGKELCKDLNLTLQMNKPQGKIANAINIYSNLTNSSGKSVHAQKEASKYQAYSIYFKAMIFGILPSTDPLNPLDPHEDKLIQLIAHMEHNRWVAEQFFSGYKPGSISDLYTNSDSNNQTQYYYINQNGIWKRLNNYRTLKLQKIDAFIRSYNCTETDPGIPYECQIYDLNLAMMTPVLYKIYLDLRN